MATRWLILTLSLLATRVFALEWWPHPSCEQRMFKSSVDKMLEQAVDIAKEMELAMELGDPKLLEAFRQIFKFDYRNPGSENEKHKQTWLCKNHAGQDHEFWPLSPGHYDIPQCWEHSGPPRGERLRRCRHATLR